MTIEIPAISEEEKILINNLATLTFRGHSLAEYSYKDSVAYMITAVGLAFLSRNAREHIHSDMNLEQFISTYEIIHHGGQTSIIQQLSFPLEKIEKEGIFIPEGIFDNTKKKRIYYHCQDNRNLLCAIEPLKGRQVVPPEVYDMTYENNESITLENLKDRRFTGLMLEFSKYMAMGCIKTFNTLNKKNQRYYESLKSSDSEGKKELLRKFDQIVLHGKEVMNYYLKTVMHYVKED